MKIRLAAPLQPDSIVDGEGIRTVIWTQGCKHNCKDCHNPGTHDFTGGFETSVETLKQQILDLKNQDGITLSGGDPLFQSKACAEIANFCKMNKLNVWCYTGFTFEELLEKSENDKDVEKLLKNVDVLIDGKFEIENKNLNLKFRGSSNQRVLDLHESLKEKKPIEIKKYKQMKKFEGYDNKENEQNGIFI